MFLIIKENRRRFNSNEALSNEIEPRDVRDDRKRSKGEKKDSQSNDYWVQ